VVKKSAAGISAFGAALAVLLALSTVHAVATSPPGGASPAARPWLRVMPLGDSITNGTGSTGRAGYRLPLWNTAAHDPRYGLDFVGSSHTGSVADADHEGHSGWKIDDLRAHVAAFLAAGDPDLVLLHIGINDLVNGQPAGAADRLASLMDEIYAARPETDVVLAGLIPSTAGVGGEVAAYNARARVLAEDARRAGRRSQYVDMPLGADELVDGLHPNDAGYRHMAAVYAATIGGIVADGDLPDRIGSVVETYAYPGRREILATEKVKLTSGDGNVRLADCAAPAAGVGVLTVRTAADPQPLCFSILGSPGFLDLVLADVSSLRLAARPQVPGLSVTASSWTADGARTDVTAPPDGSTVILDGAGSVLARLVVSG
jgi:lysophospholipase L1-like esterase